MDRDFRPQPEMVDAWQVSDDKLTYTFRLRDGLKFHDGQPVRAADAVASLKRWGQRNDSYGQPLLAAASAIEAIDEAQFRIVLKNRFPVLEALGTTTSPTPFILPERLAKVDAFTQVDGSGPFKFVKDEWQSGHKVVYIKNPDYISRAERTTGQHCRRQGGQGRPGRMTLYSRGRDRGAGARKRRGGLPRKRVE